MNPSAGCGEHISLVQRKKYSYNGSRKEKKEKERKKIRGKRGEFISFMHGIVGMLCARQGPLIHPLCDYLGYLPRPIFGRVIRQKMS
jgi:hypothetical protein